MRMVSVPLAAASEKQLRDFAEAQQYDISHVRAGDTGGLLAVIGAAWEGDTILALEDASESPAQAQPVDALAANALVGGIGANDPKVLIKFGQTQAPDGKDPVQIGVNGVIIVVMRNTLTSIPYRFYLAHQDAVRIEKNQEEGEGGKMGEMEDVSYTNYPIQHLVLPSDEEIAAWHARVDNEPMPA